MGDADWSFWRTRPARWGIAIAAATASAFLVVSLLPSDPTPTDALAAPRFFDETVSSGLDHTYDGEFDFFVGGGVATFDCDGDRFPDVFVAGGENPAALFRNTASFGSALSFELVPAASTDMTRVTGAYPIDIDGDHHIDLVVLRYGENVVLRGLGDCQFERANEAWGIDGGDAWTVGFSATWESEASWPTLAFGNYVLLDENGRQFGACSDNVVLRPIGDGYGEPTLLSPSWCSLSLLFSDWNRSGSADLRVSNDRQYYRDGEEQMWAFEAGTRPRLYEREDGWQKVQIWGMGIASYDITGDGLPEVFLTSQGDNKLQTLDPDSGGPDYTDVAIRRGATVHRPYAGDTELPSTAWHAEFEDVNNDGFVDLYVAKGNVEAMPEFAAFDPNNLLLGQPDGTFVEGAEQAGIDTFARTRGAALVDLNLDGLLDLIEVNRRDPVAVWRNVGMVDARGGSFALALEQPGPNRDAIGAWIETRIGDLMIVREVTIGGGHAGGQLGWHHVGIGPADGAEVRITWPDGEVGEWQRIELGQFAIMSKDGSVTLWNPLD